MLRADPPSAAPLQFSSSAVRGVAGSKIKTARSDALAMAWEALQRANHHVAWFFASALADEGVTSEEHLLDTMLCFGRLLPPDASLAPGDLVCGGGDRLFDGDWAVVANGDGPRPAEVVVPDGVNEKFELKRSFPRLTAAWRPTVTPVIDLRSPMGRFWGPGLFRYRRVVGLPSVLACTYEDLLDVALGGTRLPVNVDEFIEWVAPELRPAKDGFPAGAILVHEEDERIGIGVDAALCMTIDPEEVQWRVISASKARLPLVWIPHL